MAHQRKINPAAKKVTPAIAKSGQLGNAPGRQLPATNTPDVTLTAITIHSTRNVLRSCLVPVSLRPRRVIARSTSETR